MPARPMWKSVNAAMSQEQLTELMKERGTFVVADRVFDALERGELPADAERLDLDELERLYG